jgi:hypothetical protein
MRYLFITLLCLFSFTVVKAQNLDSLKTNKDCIVTYADTIYCMVTDYLFYENQIKYIPENGRGGERTLDVSDVLYLRVANEIYERLVYDSSPFIAKLVVKGCIKLYEEKMPSTSTNNLSSTTVYEGAFFTEYTNYFLVKGDIIMKLKKRTYKEDLSYLFNDNAQLVAVMDTIKFYNLQEKLSKMVSNYNQSCTNVELINSKLNQNKLVTEKNDIYAESKVGFEVFGDALYGVPFTTSKLGGMLTYKKSGYSYDFGLGLRYSLKNDNSLSFGIKYWTKELNIKYNSKAYSDIIIDSTKNVDDKGTFKYFGTYARINVLLNRVVIGGGIDYAFIHSFSSNYKIYDLEGNLLDEKKNQSKSLLIKDLKQQLDLVLYVGTYFSVGKRLIVKPLLQINIPALNVFTVGQPESNELNGEITQEGLTIPVVKLGVLVDIF